MYDYRYSVLPLVFGNLIREGRLSEEELHGLAVTNPRCAGQNGKELRVMHWRGKMSRPCASASRPKKSMVHPSGARLAVWSQTLCSSQ
jgi:hypothetical protein